MFFKTLNLIFNPFKKINYLHIYLNTVRIINLKKNTKIRNFFHFLVTLVAYECVHFFALGFLSKNFTDFQRTIHYQSTYLLIPKYTFSTFAGVVAICVIYYDYVIFERPNLMMNDLLRNILKENQTFKKEHFLYQLYNGQNVTTFIRRFSLKVLNLFASLILVVGKFPFFK